MGAEIGASVDCTACVAAAVRAGVAGSEPAGGVSPGSGRWAEIRQSCDGADLRLGADLQLLPPGTSSLAPRAYSPASTHAGCRGTRSCHEALGAPDISRCGTLSQAGS